MLFLVIFFHGVAICAGNIVRDYIPTGVWWHAEFRQSPFNGAVLLFAIPFVLISTLLCLFSILKATLAYTKYNAEITEDTNNNVHVEIENTEGESGIYVVPLPNPISDNKNME